MTEEEKLKIEQIIKTKTFPIKVITRASSDRIYLENDKIKIKIREIPENNKANKSIINLFSKTFKIPKSNITILKGGNSSNKILKIEQ